MTNQVYAILYAYYKEDAAVKNHDMYEIVLHDIVPPNYPHIPITPGYIPIYVSIHDNQKKALFKAAMEAVSNCKTSFSFSSDAGVINQYEITRVKNIDQSLAAQYKPPVPISFGKKAPTITFYLKSNKCFREKHHCTPCIAKIKPKEKYRDFVDPITINIIRCDKCNKYFVTKEIFASTGGCWCYHLRKEYDNSLSESDRHDIRFGYHYNAMQETFDHFEQHSSLNLDGYSTQKPTTVRQSLLRRFIDTGRYSGNEIIQYLHEKYLDTGWHGENATSRAREDLAFVLSYIQKDEIVDGTLERP